MRRLTDALERAKEGSGKAMVTIRARDLHDLLIDHALLDVKARSAHVVDNPAAYPPRRMMLARVASDPGAFAGYKGERTMGRWIADAIMAVERHVERPMLIEVIERNWNAGPDALADALMQLPDPGATDFTPDAVARRTHEQAMFERKGR
jgi:hypothetical protein